MIDSVILGDSLEVLRTIPSDYFRASVTSPPYWNLIDYNHNTQIGLNDTYEEYLSRLVEVFAETYRTLKPNGKLCVNTFNIPIPKDIDSTAHTRKMVTLPYDLNARILAETDFNLLSVYVWDKIRPLAMFGSYPYPPNIYDSNTTEYIFVYVKPGKPEVIEKPVKEASLITKEEWQDLRESVWRISPASAKRTGHPAPFPVALPARLIKMYTFKGDAVLDMFMGSGTTAEAAKRLGRHYVGIEYNKDYISIAENRIDNVEFDSGFDVILRKR